MQFRLEFPDAVTCMELVDSTIWVGCADGRVYVLNQTGNFNK